MGDIGGNANYDVARANWGGTWRLPTKAEMRELIDNCKWIWTTQGGRSGYKVTSKKNGVSIFLPAAGWKSLGIGGAGESGLYWSSSPYEGDTCYAFSLDFDISSHNTCWYYRYRGFSVRPVSE